MPTTVELYTTYESKMRQIADIRNAAGVLQWDQETYLPRKGATLRGQQISTLSAIAHELFSKPELGSLLADLSARDDLSPSQKRNVALSREDFDKNRKYPAPFVHELSEQTNRAFHSWMEARRQNSFAHFEKDLGALVELKKQETDILGYTEHPYNALLNEYEKGASIALLDKTFDGILPALKAILQKVQDAPAPDDNFFRQTFSREQQWEWGLYLIKELHFDTDAGRQDISEHPFCTSFNAADVRITTRIDETDFGNMTWSCIHETGHALYEQGLPPEAYGLPLGEACSYSIHESQSRLWENHVGRSIAFWQHYYPVLQARFPEQLAGIDLSTFYKGINKVQPSLIRTEADEITYHFHVFVRYELEKRLIDGSLKTSDIKEFWNAKYAELIHVSVPDDKRGCIQDVHWSHGSFGYFPTYSLGSFYAAQFYAQAQKEVPRLEEGIRSGNTMELLNWLRAKIHGKGRFYTSEELCREVTGEGLNVDHFTGYLLHKYRDMYNL
jgi:carboxypeptidase Taq